MSSPTASAPSIPSPTAMVVLASEQLWPNIHGLVHWGDKLQHLCTYYTANEKLSGQPACQLESLCKVLLPGVKVHRPVSPLGMEPGDVSKQIRKWLDMLPGQTWLLNASGGTKLMTAGVLAVVGDRSCWVVYRGLAGDWFELQQNEDGSGIRANRMDVPETITDQIRVADLVRVYWENSTCRVESGTKPEHVPVLELTRAWIASRGRWADAFTRCGLPQARSQNLFEQFVAAVVSDLGVRNLTCNAVRVSSQSGQHLQEIDLVANYLGRLLIIDCKLASADNGYRDRNVEPITAQIRQAAQTRRELGGLGARYLLLRPSTPFQEAERELAEASGLTVMDQTDCRSLFSGLRHFLGVPGDLPESLRRAEDELAQAAEWPWTNPLRPARQDVDDVVAANGGRRAVVDLDAYMRAHGQSWVAFRLGSEVEFQLTRPEGMRDSRALERLIESRFREFGQIHSFAHSHNGNTYWFRIALMRGAFDRLVGHLEPFVGRSLFAAEVSVPRR